MAGSGKDFLSALTDVTIAETSPGKQTVKEWRGDDFRFALFQRENGQKKNSTVASEGEVVFYFQMKGKTEISFMKKNCAFRSGEMHLFFPGKHFTEISSSSGAEVFILFMKTDFFSSLSASIPAFSAFEKDVHNGHPGMLAGENLSVDLALTTAIKQIMAYRGEECRMYFVAKCLEIFSLVSEVYRRKNEKKFFIVKTDYDHERLHFAREYLLQHSDYPPTIPELSRIAGINEFKLKKGFKELFGNTVYGYLSAHRMEIAAATLQEGKKSASQIAYELGYSSLQHFSAAFKKKFGFSPKNKRKA